MCELLGFSAARKEDLSDLLREFFSHSEKNPHGWGMMYDPDCRIIKGAGKAYDSSELYELLENISPQDTLLAHIRYATVGKIRIENCHPFSGRDISGREWTLIHNGTIYSGKDSYKYLNKQIGDTDSERLFLSFMDTMNDAISKGKLTERERFAVVDRFITDNAPRNKLNLIIYDGDLMYAHKNLKNTLCIKRYGKGTLIATVPLDESKWAPFPMAQVIAFRQGKVVYKGERHKGIFVPTLEYITALDAMNI